MSKPVRLNEFAEKEILDELRGYGAGQSELADRLWNDIQAILRIVGEYPRVGGRVVRPRVRGTVRRFPLRHFPFFIIYREHDAYVEIVALAHMSRKPNYWRSRLS